MTGEAPGCYYTRKTEICIEKRENRMIETVITRMIAYNHGDARRIHHALKVYAFASAIAGEEKMPERGRMVLEAAAVLHDIGIHVCEEKYGSCAGPLQEKEGPAVARPLLEGLELEEEEKERVLWLIAHHHTYTGEKQLDHQILLEADFLVNAGESGYERAAIETAREKIFRTASGIRLLDAMFFPQDRA